MTSEDLMVSFDVTRLRRKWWSLLACLVTVGGLLAGIYGVVTGTVLWLVFSLLCDLADGALARATSSDTDVGASLDWHTDVALAHLGVIMLPIEGACYLCAPLAMWQAFASMRGWRISGRAVIWAGLIAYRVLS